MGNEGEVVAVERHPRRAAALERQCARLNATCVRVHVGDAKERRAEWAGTFDRVLLDPPCSGLGTLRSHPDLRWRASPEGIERLRAEQEEMLAAARDALRPGGTLVYSVCTLSPREELVHGDVQRTFPHRDATDGFYIAREDG
jgi:16S rRNA (cytosine967-C5)-methyltransferase